MLIVYNIEITYNMKFSFFLLTEIERFIRVSPVRMKNRKIAAGRLRGSAKVEVYALAGNRPANRRSRPDYKRSTHAIGNSANGIPIAGKGLPSNLTSKLRLLRILLFK